MADLRRPSREFWRGRRVLLTGHTGFKGTWLALILSRLGAQVVGLALEPPSGPSLYRLLAGMLAVEHHAVDLRDPPRVDALIRHARVSVVLHLAGQASVPDGYRDPAGTFATNLGGTIQVLEAMRQMPDLAAAVLVTTDKVYRNLGTGRRFREDDPLGGHDPYSASKAAAEVAIESWRASFPTQLPPLAAARAGNVIGGGDFAPDRLVPDIVRALDGSQPLVLRHPHATRPWQHVLDVVAGYLLLAEDLAAGQAMPAAFNFGPSEESELAVTEIITAFERAFDTPLPWSHVSGAPPEASRLALDSTRARQSLGWQPRMDRATMIRATADWYAAWRRGDDMPARCERDVAEALA